MNSQTMRSFAVCIVNYNTRDLLHACLDSVLSNPFDTAANPIIVVDNGSTDGTLEMLKQDYPQVRLCMNTHNAGYGAAANQVIAQCDAGYVLLLNSDTRVASDALQQLWAVLDQHGDVAIVGPQLLNRDGSLQSSCFHFPTLLEVILDVANARKLIRHIPRLREVYLRTWAHTQSRAVPWVSGAALAIRRSAFDAVGGFDPSFLFYYEEIDLCFRLWQTGWQIYFAPVSDVVHVGGASSESPSRVRQAHLTVQLYAGLAHFYTQHYSTAARIALTVLFEGVMLLRYVRDRWHLQRTNTGEERAALQSNLNAWRRMLRGQWLHQVNLTVPGPASHHP